MSKKELIKYLIVNNVSVPVTQIVAGMLIALLLSVFIYWIYKKTYTGVMYSRDFNLTIVMLALITTFIIMIIGSNLALSLGLVGALSIIRFRTAVKNTKDAAFLFWAIGVGLSCGTGIYTIGILSSALIAAALLFFHKVKMTDELSYLLVIRGKTVDTQALERLLEKKVKRFHLRMTSHGSEAEEYTYELLLKETAGELVKQISSEFQDTEIHLLSYRGELSGET